MIVLSPPEALFCKKPHQLLMDLDGCIIHIYKKHAYLDRWNIAYVPTWKELMLEKFFSRLGPQFSTNMHDTLISKHNLIKHSLKI